MKEARYFFVPNAETAQELPPEEAAHALKVLRLSAGDEMFLMDGQGCYFRARITMTSQRHCCYELLERLPQSPQWNGRLHLAVAPTKMMERTEWMVEKATEVGVNSITLLDCQFSERRVVKTPRLQKIVVSAVKQSRKAWIPEVGEMVPFRQFVAERREGLRYIAHCYEEIPRTYLFDELRKAPDADVVTVMIGPEGDFSVEEVRQAMSAGWQSVHLGSSRLRTETAGLAAVMMMHLARE